jgi:NADPH:quinone reductase-like Zn-dependent oxidoreductase
MIPVLHFGDWMAEREIKAVIDKTYPWEDVPQAYRYLREGHARDKIVVSFAYPD